MPARRNSRYQRLFGLTLLLCCSACSRRSSEPDRAARGGAPSGSALAQAPRSPLPRAKPPAPPTSPAAPPQLVACGEREFYRITHRSLDVFQIAEHLPPPQIRGSKVAQQTDRVELADPLNVVSLSKKSVLVIAEAAVLRYQLGEKAPQRYAAVPVRGPLFVSLDPRAVDGFWLRTLGEDEPQHYALSSLALGDAGVPRVRAELPRSVAGALDAGAPSEAAPLAFAASLPGVLIDTATDGDRVGVLSMELVGDTYQPALAVFSQGKEEARLKLGPSVGLQLQPKLDLCLIPGRPWVVVGNTQWLQLLDWSSRRLLAEW